MNGFCNGRVHELVGCVEVADGDSLAGDLLVAPAHMVQACPCRPCTTE